MKIELRMFDSSIAQQLSVKANNLNIAKNLKDTFPHPYTLRDAHYFIAEIANAEENLVRAIFVDSEFAGGCGLHGQGDIYKKSMELGYWLAEDFWGKGITTQAIGLILELGFKEKDINRIFASALDFNQASIRVLEKNGFKKEGVTLKSAFKNGDYWNEHKYGLLREDFYS